MKSLSTYISINENFKFKINRNTKIHSIVPETFSELQKLIADRANNLDSNEILDLTDIDISKVEYISCPSGYSDHSYKGIFGKVMCSKLYIIDVSGWDVSRFDCLGGLFSSFHELVEIRGLETWDVSNVTDMQGMFRGCKLLKTVNIDDWNVSNLRNTMQMFSECRRIEMNLSNWQLLPFCKRDGMFDLCKDSSIPDWAYK